MPSYKLLFVFVEGVNDEDFFNSVFRPCLESKYDYVKIVRYRGDTADKIRQFIHSIDSMSMADYVFISDFDSSPCITHKKDNLVNDYRVDGTKTFIVKTEIESWYLAGLTASQCKQLGLRDIVSTDAITKEDFENLIPKNIGYKALFLEMILERFSKRTAVVKNKSFGYVYKKLGC